MVGYIFGGSTGETPESLKRKRDIADALVGRILGQHSAPRTVGEAVSQGLSGIGQALIARRMEKRADKAASLGRSSANAAISSLAENMGGNAGNFPAAPGTPSPSASAEPTDAPSQRVASAFAASEPDSGTGDRVTTAANRAGVSSETARKNPMELASSLLGKGEVPDRATIQEYLKNGGVNLDPATTAWCAAFVNASLGQAGIPGTGSNMARSFLKWGQGVDTPAAGDIGVLPRGDPNGPYGHVGFVEGYDPKTGMVTLLAGNQGNAVSEKQFPADRFLGFRRGPAGAPAVAATNAMAGNSPTVPPLPAPVNVPDMPVASPQPVQVAQATNTGTPGQMSDANALALLGASPVHPGKGASLVDLLRTASNPWLNKNETAILQALTANKLKQQDPAAQLDMRYKQAQLDNLLHPQAKPTSDMQNYEFYSAQEKAAGRQPLSYNDWNLQSKKAGATTINNNVSAGGDFSKQLQKNVADNVLEQRVGAQDAADLIKIINEGRGILDSGAITGAGANYKVGALKLAGAMGIPIPQDAADNTQAFRAVMGQAVGKIIKQFGSGTGLSDADRQYAERIAGGDVTLNEEAIRRILDIADKAARGRIKAWQQKVPEVLKGDMGSMLAVQMPDAYSPPAASGSPQPGQVEDGYRFKGGNPSDPNSWEPVQ